MGSAIPLELLLFIALRATAKAFPEILSVYGGSFTVDSKADRSPITEADRRSNRIITEELTQHSPYPILSEEGKNVPFSERRDWQRFWMVDPLDGTKEFIEGVPQFVVSIALVKHGVPVLGVLFNPVTKETFTATAGNGATLNSKPLKVSEVKELEKAVILNSRSETRRGLWESYQPYFRRLMPVGSVAYKLGITAAGRADMFATLRPKNEWDVCAGHMILKEAGAELRVLDGSERRYNSQQVIIKPGLVAGNPNIVQSFLDLRRSFS